MMQTIMLAAGEKIEQVWDNTVAVYSPYINFKMYNLSITKKIKWSPIII